jgi:hypothetical protein
MNGDTIIPWEKMECALLYPMVDTYACELPAMEITAVFVLLVKGRVFQICPLSACALPMTSKLVWR